MNTTALVIGSTFAGLLLGAIATALILLPRLNHLSDQLADVTDAVDDLTDAIDEQAEIDSKFYEAAYPQHRMTGKGSVDVG